MPESRSPRYQSVLAMGLEGPSAARSFTARTYAVRPAPGKGNVKRIVGNLTGSLIDLTASEHTIWAALDKQSSRNRDIGMAAFHGRTPGLADTLIVVNHLSLTRAHRGVGMGIILLEAVLQQLTVNRACDIALDPRPDGWQAMDPESLARSTAAIEGHFAAIGFRRPSPTADHMSLFSIDYEPMYEAWPMRSD